MASQTLRTSILRAAVLGLALTLGAGSAFAAEEAAPAAAKTPAKAESKPVAKPLPVGGYLPQPAGSLILRELKWGSADGYALYTLDRECNGQCAVLFPPLTPPTPDAKPPSRAWTIRVREENGALQWVYKGKPVYVFAQDKPGEPPTADSIVPGVKLARK